MPGFLANGHALMQDLHLIPARKGSAARMRAGQVVRVVNTHGSQVVDFWACPQDMLPINGSDCVIHDAHYAIFDAEYRPV